MNYDYELDNENGTRSTWEEHGQVDRYLSVFNVMGMTQKCWQAWRISIVEMNWVNAKWW